MLKTILFVCLLGVALSAVIQETQNSKNETKSDESAHRLSDPNDCDLCIAYAKLNLELKSGKINEQQFTQELKKFIKSFDNMLNAVAWLRKNAFKITFDLARSNSTAEESCKKLNLCQVQLAEASDDDDDEKLMDMFSFEDEENDTESSDENENMEEETDEENDDDDDDEVEGRPINGRKCNRCRRFAQIVQKALKRQISLKEFNKRLRSFVRSFPIRILGRWWLRQNALNIIIRLAIFNTCPTKVCSKLGFCRRNGAEPADALDEYMELNKLIDESSNELSMIEDVEEDVTGSNKTCTRCTRFAQLAYKALNRQITVKTFDNRLKKFVKSFESRKFGQEWLNKHGLRIFVQLAITRSIPSVTCANLKFCKAATELSQLFDNEQEKESLDFFNVQDDAVNFEEAEEEQEENSRDFKCSNCTSFAQLAEKALKKQVDVTGFYNQLRVFVSSFKFRRDGNAWLNKNALKIFVQLAITKSTPPVACTKLKFCKRSVESVSLEEQHMELFGNDELANLESDDEVDFSRDFRCLNCTAFAQLADKVLKQQITVPEYKKQLREFVATFRYRRNGYAWLRVNALKIFVQLAITKTTPLDACKKLRLCTSAPGEIVEDNDELEDLFNIEDTDEEFDLEQTDDESSNINKTCDRCKVFAGVIDKVLKKEITKKEMMKQFKAFVKTFTLKIKGWNWIRKNGFKLFGEIYFKKSTPEVACKNLQMCTSLSGFVNTENGKDGEQQEEDIFAF